MYIDKKAVKNVNISLGVSDYSKVYYLKYQNKEYAYKVFNNKEFNISNEQQKRFEELCKKYDGSSIILPKYLIGEKHIDSYLMDYYKGLPFDRMFLKSYETRAKYLKKVKELIIKINEDMSIVHSDIHFGNLLFNEINDSVAIIDFDNAKINNLEQEKIFLQENVKAYLFYNDYDKGVDVYTFNLLTFALMNNLSIEISKKYFFDSEINKLFTSDEALEIIKDMSIYKKNNKFLIDVVDKKI